MNLSLSSEQLTFQESVARYSSAVQPVATDAGRDGWRTKWREMADLGWIGSGLSVEEGGFGGGPVEVMIVMEGAGSSLARVPLVETGVIATRILSHTARNGLLEETIAGTRVIVPAFIPVGRDRDLPALTANGRGFHLDGACSLVTFGDQCDGLLVLASSRTGETSLVHIELPCEGVHIEACAALDGGRVARIRFDYVSVPEASVLARGEEADAIVADVIDHATGAICAEALGIASMLHSRTLDYAAQRVQFGQPIAKFQAIQHRFADMFMALEEARSLTIMATTALGQPRSAGRTVSLAAAKIGVMSRALHIARESIQLHGGIGVTSELPLGDGLRRLKVLNVLLGDEEHHLAVMNNAQQQEPAR